MKKIINTIRGYLLCGFYGKTYLTSEKLDSFIKEIIHHVENGDATLSYGREYGFGQYYTINYRNKYGDYYEIWNNNKYYAWLSTVNTSVFSDTIFDREMPSYETIYLFKKLVDKVCKPQ